MKLLPKPKRLIIFSILLFCFGLLIIYVSSYFFPQLITNILLLLFVLFISVSVMHFSGYLFSDFQNKIAKSLTLQFKKYSGVHDIIVQPISNEDFQNQISTLKLSKNTENLSIAAYSHEIVIQKSTHALFSILEFHKDVFATRTQVGMHHGTYICLLLPNTQTSQKFYLVPNAGLREQADYSPLRQVFGINEVEETDLEWNDFEHSFRVMTANPVYAREILTPDIMEKVYLWHKEHQSQILFAATPAGTALCVESQLLYDKTFFSSPEITIFEKELEKCFTLFDVFSRALLQAKED